MSFNVDMARGALEKMDAAMEQHKEYLTDLDSAIGDADHGANMCRGFHKAMDKIRANEYTEFGAIFKEVAMAMMGSVGGSAGPLYGTFFMKLSQKLAGKGEVSVSELAEGFEAGLAGLMAIGKGLLGDKTMIDALSPAIAALKSASDEQAAWAAAAAAAQKGMEDTIPMLAKKGRASYLGERSIGHQDPGATSAYMLINCFKQAAGGE